MADAGNAYTQAINNAVASAKSMLGKNEVPNHAELQSYLRDGGQDLDPHKLAWCAAFVSASLQKAGLPVPTQVVKDSAFGPGAYAPNYLTYGSAVDPKNIQAGDILVNNNGSHVGFAEGPMRQGANGPEVQLLAGNQRDPSGQYAPGSYTNPATGAVANRSQVGMVGEQWVPLSQYSARRYTPTGDGSQPAAASSSTSSGAPSGTTLNSAPAPLTMPGSAPNAGKYQPLIDAAAQKYNLDPAWFGRLLYQENRFQPQGTSPAGAQGFAQFMPATAKRYGVDVSDPASSIEGSAHYLADNLKLFNNNPGLAAAAYNWGEGNVQKWQAGGWNVPKETQNYVQTITGHSMDEWKTGTPAPTTPGTTLNSPPAAAGGSAAAPATGQPAPAAGGWAGQLASALKPLAGGKGGGGGGGGGGDDQPQPMQLPMAPQAQAVGGPMMIGLGGQNVMGQRTAQNALAQQGFMMQPTLAANTLGATRPPVPSMMPGQATGIPGLPGTTLNSPSQLQMALMTGAMSPYDLYAANAAQGGGFPTGSY